MIKIEPHTIERALERGTTSEEIFDTINNGVFGIAKKDRFLKYKIFIFNDIRNGKYYKHKKVEVIFKKEESTFITITVYVYYGTWEEMKDDN